MICLFQHNVSFQCSLISSLAVMKCASGSLPGSHVMMSLNNG